jgi:phospholipase C
VKGVPVGLGFRVPTLLVSPWYARRLGELGGLRSHLDPCSSLERWSAATGKPARCPVDQPLAAQRVRRSHLGVSTSARPSTASPRCRGPEASILVSACKSLPSPKPRASRRPTQEPGTRPGPARALPAERLGIWNHHPRVNTRSCASAQQRRRSRAKARALHRVSQRPPRRRALSVQRRAARLGRATRSASEQGFGAAATTSASVGPNRFLRHVTGDARRAGPRTSRPWRSTRSIRPSSRLALWVRAHEPERPRA